MYKYLEYEGTKYPIRVSNCVLGEWQEETGKTDIKNMSFRDIRILLWHALVEGAEFAETEFLLKRKDIKLMMENTNTVSTFVKMIPEFFPKQEEGGEGGKPMKRVVVQQ